MMQDLVYEMSVYTYRMYRYLLTLCTQTALGNKGLN